MLAILEFVFTIAGLYALISGKIPKGLFNTLFGHGDYNLSSGKVRLWGLFLASPFPVLVPITIVLMLLFPENGKIAGMIIEILYIVLIGIASIIFAKKIRNSEAPFTGSQEAIPPQN